MGMKLRASNTQPLPRGSRKSYSDYVKAKSHDWSNAYVTYDIDTEQKKLLGYVV